MLSPLGSKSPRIDPRIFLHAAHLTLDLQAKKKEGIGMKLSGAMGNMKLEREISAFKMELDRLKRDVELRASSADVMDLAGQLRSTVKDAEMTLMRKVQASLLRLDQKMVDDLGEITTWKQRVEGDMNEVRAIVGSDGNSLCRNPGNAR